jgi:signal transduction histidine kinase/ActR/RegA family two-component response regulator
MNWAFADKLAGADPSKDLEFAIRARVALAICVATVLSGIGIELTVYASNPGARLDPIGFITSGVTLLFTCAGLALRRPGYVLAAIFVTVLIALTWASWLNRGVYAPALVFLPGIITSVYFVFGMRVTLVFAGPMLGLLYWVTYLSTQYAVGDARVGVDAIVPMMALQSILVCALTVLVSTTFRSAVSDARRQLEKSNQDLKKALHTASSANASKALFLSNMSHEFRTPLNGVLGMTSVLKNEDELPEHYKAHLDVIEESGQDLLTLLTNVLEFVTEQNGTSPLQSVDYCPNQLVREAQCTWAPAALGKKLILSFEDEDEPAQRLLGDPDRLRRALDNLLANAVKFTDRGRITLKLTQDASPSGDGLTTRISVTDSGIGIPESEREKIFAPFNQIDSSNSRRYGGSGIGLTTSRKLMADMNGDIELDSTAGLGSRFTLVICDPVCEDVSVERVDEVAVTDRQAIASLSRVLVVDDDDTNRAVLQALLLQTFPDQRLEIVEAQSGLEAIQRVKNQRFDLVFMDIGMPDMDGITALRQIRLLPAQSRLPVVAVTARAMPGDRQKILDAGFCDYLPKPVNRTTLEGLFRPVLAEPESSQGDITLNDQASGTG